MTGYVGPAVGAVAGAVMSYHVKEDPVAEDNYWHDNYSSRPNVTGGKTYDEYQLACRYGADSYTNYLNHSLDGVEPKLSRDWRTAWGTSSMDWERAKHAWRDTWHRASMQMSARFGPQRPLIHCCTQRRR